MLGAFTAARGQLVTPKTVPVRQDEQFAIIPSARAGMGGLSIALDDSLADPFVNPARALFGHGGTVFSAPFSHNITGGHGGGRTLPIGFATSGGAWAGAFVGVAQSLDHNGSSNPVNVGSFNRYGSASLARRVGDDLTIGLAGSYSRLNAIDGADLLYDGSDAVTQTGTITDVRLGASKHWGERRLDLVVVNARTDITHSVAYSGNVYNYGAQGMLHYENTDENLDRTHAWGIHTKFSQALSDGWRFGWIATANRLTHPKIPNYDVKNVPFVWHDPGTTYAYNFGVGLARSTPLLSYGMEFIQEPITSNTWGENDAGEHTVDNKFRFSNSRLRFGLGKDFLLASDSSALLGFQVGQEFYSIRYNLDQSDHVSGQSRSDLEDWTEWTPTFGMSLRLKHATVRYNWRMTCSRDCISFPMASGDKVTVPAATLGTTLIAAPTRAVNVDGGSSHFHQLIVTIPIR